MDTNEVIAHVRSYLQQESRRIDFGEIGFTVAVHRNELRKLEFHTTVKQRPNPNSGSLHDSTSS